MDMFSARQRPRARRLPAALIVPALWAAASVAGAQQLDFETPGAGWTAIGPGVAWESERPLQGRHSLSLDSSAGETWAVSEPLEGFTPGAPVEVSLAVRRVSGEADFALALVSGAEGPEGPPLWRGAPTRDARARRLALRIVTGLPAPRLALGALGAPGAWLVDDIRISPTRVAPVTRPVSRELVPRYPEALPADWLPEGNMDLQARSILGRDSYYILPGPLELNPQREIALHRGERVGMFMDALSRSEATRGLLIEAAGPAGWRTELVETRLEGRRSVTVNIPLQPMQAGETHLRVRFTYDGDVKEMPVLVRSVRYYPALGVLWTPEAALETGLGPFAALPTQLHQATVRGPADLPAAARLAATGADLALMWDMPPGEAVDALRGLPQALGERAALFGLDDADAEVEAQRALLSAVREFSLEAVALSRPFDLRATPGGLVGDAALTAALEAAPGAHADALRVRLPRLGGAAVLRETVDGRAPAEPMLAWQHFDHHWDMAALRALLREKDAQLPFFCEGVGGTSTGDAGLDALVLVRVLLHVFAMGATAVTIPASAAPGDISLVGADGRPNATLLEVYGELARELAGVRSLTPPGDTDVAGYLSDKPVTFRHFMRGDEGIIALWNNTQAPQSVAVDVRCRPVQLRLLRISYPGEPWQREFVSDFQWDALARHWGQPAVYLDLQPLQVVILSLKLRGAHQGWLREVGPRPPPPPRPEPARR